MPKFRLIMELENSGLPHPIEEDSFNDPQYLGSIEAYMDRVGLLIDGEHITSTKLEAVEEVKDDAPFCDPPDSTDTGLAST